MKKIINIMLLAFLTLPLFGFTMGTTDVYDDYVYKERYYNAGKPNNPTGVGSRTNSSGSYNRNALSMVMLISSQDHATLYEKYTWGSDAGTIADGTHAVEFGTTGLMLKQSVWVIPAGGTTATTNMKSSTLVMRDGINNTFVPTAGLSMIDNLLIDSPNASNLRNHLTSGARSAVISPVMSVRTGSEVHSTVVAGRTYRNGSGAFTAPTRTYYNFNSFKAGISGLRAVEMEKLRTDLFNQTVLLPKIPTLDNIPPVVSISANTTAWTNGNVTLTGTATDAGSGVKRVRNHAGTWNTGASNTTVATTNGTYTFTAEDNAGNTGTNSRAVTNIDKTAPTGSLAQTPTAWTNGDVTLNLTSIADAGGSGYYRTKRPDGTFVTTTSAAQTVSANGTYTFTIYDNAGNSRNNGITVSNIDKTNPSAPTINRSRTGWGSGNSTFTVSGGTDGDSGVHSRQYRLNGGSWVTYSSTVTVSTNGTTKIDARTRDNAGNFSSITTANVYKDETAPTVPTLTLSRAGWGNTNVTFTVTGGSDAHSGVARLEYKIGTGAWTTYTTTATVSANGSTTVYARTVDNVGRLSSEVSAIAYKEVTAPTVSLSPNSMAGWQNAGIPFTATFADAGGSGFNNWRVRYETDGVWGAFSALNTTTSSSSNLTGNGQRRIQYEVTDKAGNSTTHTSGNYYVDTTAPTGTTSISPSIWTNGNVTITLSASDTGGSGYYRTLLPSGAYSTSATPTHVVSANGTYSFTVYDNAGNSRVVTRVVSNIDKVAPTGTTSISPSIWTNGNVTITLSASDTGGSLYYRTLLPSGAYSTSATPTHVVSANGTYSFTVYDNAGNSTVVTRTVSNIDKIVPTGTTSISPTAWTNGNVTITLSASDTGGSLYYRTLLPSGAYSTSATPTHVVSANGTYSFTVYDNAGNSRVVSHTVSSIDKLAPSGVITQSPISSIWTNGNVVLTFNATDTGGSGVKDVRIAGGTWITGSSTTRTVTANGTYSFEVRDNAGNTATIATTVNNIDKTVPVININPNGNGIYQKTQSAIVTVTDAASGVATRQYGWSSNTTTVPTWINFASGASISSPINTGDHYLWVKATDVAGNESIVKSNVFRVDNTLPEGVITPSITSWTNGNVTLTINTTDAHAGVKQVRISGGTWVTGNTTSRVVTVNGTYSFEIEDNAGNLRTISYTVSNIDKNKPSGLFNPNGAIWRNTGLNVTFTPSDTGGSNVANWKWSLSSNNGSTYGAETTVSGGGAGIIAVPNTEGLWRIRVVVTDNAGNVEALVSNVYQIDKTLPLGVFTPNSHTWTNGSITTSFNPSDLGGSGVASWRYRTAQNGSTYGAWSTIINGSTASNIVLSGQGTWRVQAEVTDIGGNINTLTSGIFNIDTTLPSGVFTPNSATWRNTGLTVSFNPSDTGGSGVREWRFRNSSNNGSTYGDWSAMVVGDTTSNIVIPNAEGLWRTQVEVHDIAGNVNILTSGVYQVDKSLPSGLFSPNSRVWGGAGLTVSFDPSDTGGSGVSNWRYQISSDNGVTFGGWSGLIVGDTTSSITIPSASNRYVIQVEVNDIAGNTRVFRSGVYLVDTTNPTGVFTPNSATWTKNTVTTSFNPDDGVGSGVQRWRYRIAQNGNIATPTYGVWSAYVLGDTTSNISMTTQGEWRIQVEVEDNVGNKEVYTSGVYHVDKTLPNVALSPNEAAWRNSSISVAINPTDYSGIGTSGVNNYRYRISSNNGATYGAYTNVAGSGISNVTFSTQGEWMIDVDVYDRATNTLNKQSGVYLIDTTPPNGSYSPNLGGWVNTNLNTRFTPTDNTGIGGSAVRQYTWVHKLDGVVKATATVLGGGFRDFTFVEDGIHTVETLVTDNAGNTRQVNSGQFRIDKTKPLGSNTINYNEHTGVYTIVPSGIQDSLAVSSNISGMDRWVITFTAKNSAGSIIGTNSITRNVYIGNTIQNIHTMFNGRADKIEVTSRLYDAAGNYLDLQSRADEIFVVKTDITKVLDNGETTAVIDVGKTIDVKGGELMRIKIEALGNPDRVEVTGIGRGILNPDETDRTKWVYGAYGKLLANFNYTIYNTETALGSGVVVNLTNAARVHSIYSSNVTTAKDVFVDVFQEAGEYDVKITAYKNNGVMYERTVTHKVYVGVEPTIKELRTRLMFKLPGR